MVVPVIDMWNYCWKQVLHQTIEKDLKDINSRVSEASKNLRIERVRLIKLKVKEVLGKDVHISIKDVNTDVKVQPNLNDLHTTDGIVSLCFLIWFNLMSKKKSLDFIL